MRALVIALLPAVLIACGSGRRLVANYEVLPVPAALSLYEPGRGWNLALGAPDTARPPGTSVETHPGLDRLDAGDRRDLVARLQIPPAGWIGGALGLESRARASLELGGLRHVSVADARGLEDTRAVLWEAIVAERMVLRLEEESGAALDLSAELVRDRVAGAMGTQPAALRVERRADGHYEVAAEEPLVVAIRVVRIERTVDEGTTPFDLSTPARDLAQPARLGYRVTAQEPVDPLLRVAHVSIRNARFVQWTGATFTFGPELPTWVNRNPQVIAGDDRAAARAACVWDSMTLEWPRDLAACRLHTVRQYVRLTTVPSGLADTR